MPDLTRMSFRSQADHSKNINYVNQGEILGLVVLNDIKVELNHLGN